MGFANPASPSQVAASLTFAGSVPSTSRGRGDEAVLQGLVPSLVDFAGAINRRTGALLTSTAAVSTEIDLLPSDPNSQYIIRAIVYSTNVNALQLWYNSSYSSVGSFLFFVFGAMCNPAAQGPVRMDYERPGFIMHRGDKLTFGVPAVAGTYYVLVYYDAVYY